MTTDRAAIAVAAREDTTATVPVEHLTLTQLCDHIERTRHARLRVELPRLGVMFHKVAAVHGLHHPWVGEMAGIFEPLELTLLQHIETEERVLFPLIRQLETPNLDALRATLTFASPLAVMEHEHDEAGGALVRLRMLSNGFTAPAGACNTFVAMLASLRELESDVHWLVHTENHVLFPRAVALAGQ
jgi:regulator of cell morphogenesis and NO signaling